MVVIFTDDFLSSSKVRCGCGIAGAKISLKSWERELGGPQRLSSANEGHM